MKLKSLVSAIFMMFTLLLAGSTGAEAAEPAETVQHETAAEIPVGTDGYSAGYNKYSAGSEGPQDFYVYEGRVYLLDSKNDRILVYTGAEFEQCIELDAYCTMLEILDNEIYVLAFTQNAVLKFDMEGRLQEKYPLGCDASAVKGITQRDGRVMILNAAGQMLAYDTRFSRFSIVRRDIEKVDFSIQGKKTYYENDILIKEYLTNVTSDYAILHRYNNQSDHLVGDEYITKLRQGEQIAWYKLDMEDWTVLPMRYFRVIDGKPYFMSCYGDRVIVREVVFAEEIKDSFPGAVAGLTEEIKKMTSVRKSAAAMNKISLSRAQVISRAESMRTIYWMLEEKHKVVRGSAVLPKVIKDAPAGRSFQGIPYCWGGFCGVSDAASDKEYGGKFADKITTVFDDDTMFMAGNVSRKTPGYVSKTIGLDCSGFVSSAYGLSAKKGTSDLENTSNFYTVALEKLQTGDMLVSLKERHVYLYVGMKDENTYMVYDCNSSSSTGRVLKREVTAEHIKEFEYVGRTPWIN